MITFDNRHVVPIGYAGFFVGGILAACALLIVGQDAAWAPLGLLVCVVFFGALAVGWYHAAPFASDATSASTVLEVVLIGVLALIIAFSEPGRIAPMGVLMVGLSVGTLILLRICRRYADVVRGIPARHPLPNCENRRKSHTYGTPYADCLDGRDRMAGTTLEPVGLSCLTVREGEVLAWLVRGYSLRTIAAELGVTAGTVDTHVRHIYQKLGVHKRDELLRLLGGRTAGR